MVHLAARGRVVHTLVRAERFCTERPANEETEMKAIASSQDTLSFDATSNTRGTIM